MILVANVASRCGYTPQYEALQRLHDTYGDRGLTVIGCPSNQFGEQEPGDDEEIASFCSSTYGVTFPISAKLDVNGSRKHPLFDSLTELADGDGRAGDVVWNFEKFIVDSDGTPAGRFRSTTSPDDPEVIDLIESLLPAEAEFAWETRLAGDVRVGDRIRLGTVELQVTRIDDWFLGLDGFLYFVEDTEARWLARPARADAEVEVRVDA